MLTKKGFTLVELLIVIAIIGILSSIVISKLRMGVVKAKDATRMSDVYQYGLLLNSCSTDTGKFPDCEFSGTCDEISPGKYKFVSSCGCWGGQFQATILTGCPMFTSSQLPVDPVNSSPLAYFYYYFEPGFADVDPFCRGKFAFMTNLESSRSPSTIKCSTDGTKVPGAGPNSFWTVLGN